jgi:cytoskeleton protein RodZ
VPGSTAAADSAASGTATPARGKGMEVTLRFASDSWVEVYDAKGEKLFYDIGSADSQRTIFGTPPFRVTFANAPGVSLDVNGKPATVPANAVHEEAADFIINRSGRIVRARPAAPPPEGK